MSEDCAGRHVCEPDHWPSGPDESWTCPECGRAHRSFPVTPDSVRIPESLRHLIPADMWGWTSSPVGHTVGHPINERNQP